MPALKVVYCLTSSGGDLYEAMTRVSLATVRLTNPTARIEIACDQQTHHALHATGSQLLREADAVHAFSTPDGTPTFRNRFIKTQLGCLIAGPFLFLDSDIVVRKPLTDLLYLHCDIAAAPNHSRDTLIEQIWLEDQANLDAMGWLVRQPYLNGGVIWYAATNGSYRFADAWHRNWLINGDRTERYRDQPALNFTTSSDQSIKVTVLTHEWNLQFAFRTFCYEEAFIWHCYSTRSMVVPDLFMRCSKLLMNRKSKNLPTKAIKHLVCAASPQITGIPALKHNLRLRTRIKNYFNLV